jgi:hypothetical protein
MTLVGNAVRAQARTRSIYRSRGVLVTGVDVHSLRLNANRGWRSDQGTGPHQMRGLSRQHNCFSKSIFQG